MWPDQGLRVWFPEALHYGVQSPTTLAETTEFVHIVCTTQCAPLPPSAPPPPRPSTKAASTSSSSMNWTRVAFFPLPVQRSAGCAKMATQPTFQSRSPILEAPVHTNPKHPTCDREEFNSWIHGQCTAAQTCGSLPGESQMALQPTH